MSKLAAALKLAERGFYVLQLRPNGKRPMHTGGVNGATSDARQIKEWWGAEPDGNVGIAPALSGHGVVDIDVKGEVNGWDALNEFEMGFALTHGTLEARTPSGGAHLIYTVPEPIRSTAGLFGPGVDTRGDGGYIVAPPSTINGRAYEWVGRRPPRQMPAAMMARIGRAENRSEHADEALVELDDPAAIRRAEVWLKKEAAGGRVAVEGSGGNNFTYQTAEVLRDFGLSADAATEALEEHWNPLCQPPWENSDLEQIVLNAYRYAKRPAGTRSTAVAGQAFDALADKLEESRRARLSGSRFRILRWGEIMELPEPEWLVADTITEQSTVLMFGAYGAYKSFIALDLALHAALGKTWAGRAIARPCRTLYVAGEGALGIKHRAAAWAERHGSTGVPGFDLMGTMPLFGDAEQFSEFLEVLQQANDAEPIDFVFIDTVARAMAGLDENAQKDVGLFVHRVDQLREVLRCTVVGVHHSGKDVSKGARGSTVLPASVDTMFKIETPRPKEVFISMDKQKDAEMWRAPLGMVARAVGKSLVFDPGNVTPATEDAVSTRRAEVAEKILLDAVTVPMGNSALARQIADEIDGSAYETVRKWLQRSFRASRPDLIAGRDPLEWAHPDRVANHGGEVL